MYTQMGIREAIQKRPHRGILAAVLLLLLAVFVAAQRWFIAADQANPASRDLAWFTTDDGATWFSDSVTKLAPFDHNGAPAYRCYVYSCDRGKTKFVAYLERFTPEAKKQMETFRSKPGTPPIAISSLMTTGVEVKERGATKWILHTDPRAAAMIMPKCPGNSGTPEPILP